MKNWAMRRLVVLSGVISLTAILAVISVFRSQSRISTDANKKRVISERISRSSSGNREDKLKVVRASGAEAHSRESSTVSTAELFNFDPEGFDQAWTHIYTKFTPESERNLFLRQIVMRMASLGHMAEPLEEITKSFGMGSVRSNLISGCFSSCDSPAAFIAAYKALGNDDDRKSALGGLRDCIGRYMIAKGGVGISRDQLDFLSKREYDAIIVDAADNYFVQMSETSANGASVALKTVLAMGLDDTATGEILGRIAQFQPFDAWSEYCLRKNTLDSRVGQKIAAAMIEEDPARAVSIIATGGGREILNSAIYSWGRLDRSKAFEWLQEVGPSLGTQEYIGAINGISRLLTEEGSYNEAREWAKRVSDPELRSRLEGQVWSAERDSLRNEMGKSPGETMQAIATGQSKYAEYWLEEAMGTWISKDFDKAQTWYQDNWNKLPANKSQYLAAAFAKQAASQGDTASARQWAVYIQDPKTKQRIEAGIAKAEAAKQN